MFGLFASTDKRKKYIETLLYRSRELRILQEINQLRGSTHNLTVLLSKISKLVMGQLDVRSVVALVSSADDQKLEIVSSTQAIREIEHNHVLKRIATDTMQSAFPIVVGSTRMHPTLRRYRIRSLLAVPLMIYSGAIGALVVMNKQRGFSRQDVRLLSAIATQTAAAIEFIKLNRQIERKEQETTALHKLLYEKERLRAKTDEMTQLYNKRFFHRGDE